MARPSAVISSSLVAAGPEPSVALAAGDQLGEGPSWHAEHGELSWVDINRGLLRRWRPEDDGQDTLELGAPVSFAVVREGGGFAVGRRDRIGLIGLDGQETPLMQLPDPPADTRFNDAKCDAAGRLWAGTTSTVRRPGDGSLYRVDPDGEAVEVISSTTISNGLGWSPDATLFYFVDSTTQQIDVFDFELTSGRIANRRPWVEIDPSDGLPDGLTVDTEGGVWLCLFGGGCVRRYDPEGHLEAVIQLPVSNPTSPAFGGPDLDRLYVTSAQHRLTPQQLEEEVLAGAIFEIAAGVRGLPGHRFPA
jgi:sugar lactone lactonase YvrE